MYRIKTMKGTILFRTFDVSVFLAVVTGLAKQGLDVTAYLDESNDEYVVRTTTDSEVGF
jgi:hypothetical protein